MGVRVQIKKIPTTMCSQRERERDTVFGGCWPEKQGKGSEMGD